MPVYHVTLIAPNGNRVTRPLVAANAAEARTAMEVEHGIDDAEAEGIQVDVRPAYDPDRQYEASLLRMAARQRERDLWERRR